MSRRIPRWGYALLIAAVLAVAGVAASLATSSSGGHHTARLGNHVVAVSRTHEGPGEGPDRTHQASGPAGRQVRRPVRPCRTRRVRERDGPAQQEGEMRCHVDADRQHAAPRRLARLRGTDPVLTPARAGSAGRRSPAASPRSPTTRRRRDASSPRPRRAASGSRPTGGASWRSVGDNLPTRRWAASPISTANGGTLIAGTGDNAVGGIFTPTGLGVYTSRNDGKTWTKSTGVPDGLVATGSQSTRTTPTSATSRPARASTARPTTASPYTNVILPTDCTDVNTRPVHLRERRLGRRRPARNRRSHRRHRLGVRPAKRSPGS